MPEFCNFFVFSAYFWYNNISYWNFSKFWERLVRSDPRLGILWSYRQQPSGYNRSQSAGSLDPQRKHRLLVHLPLARTGCNCGQSKDTGKARYAARQWKGISLHLGSGKSASDHLRSSRSAPEWNLYGSQSWIWGYTATWQRRGHGCLDQQIIWTVHTKKHQSGRHPVLVFLLSVRTADKADF